MKQQMMNFLFAIYSILGETLEVNWSSFLFCIQLNWIESRKNDCKWGWIQRSDEDVKGLATFKTIRWPFLLLRLNHFLQSSLVWCCNGSIVSWSVQCNKILIHYHLKWKFNWLKSFLLQPTVILHETIH